MTDERPTTYPHDLDAERAVLGAILLDNDVLPDVVAMLTPADFYHTAHQATFAAMVELHTAGKPVDPVLLLDQLRSAKRLEEAGGFMGIAALEQYCLTTGGTAFLAGVVKEKALLRQQLAAAQQVIDAVTTGKTSAEVITLAQAQAEAISKASPVRKVMTGREFLAKQLPPVEWIVEGLIPPGITVIVADPKVGKSRLATKIMGCVASGTPLWDRLTAKGRVLYIDRDESEDEMQERLRATWFPGTAADNFDIDFDMPNLDKGGLNAIDRWVQEHEDARLIIFDTWAKVRPSTKGKRDAYTEDNEAIDPLKEWTRKHPQIAVMLIHHTSKTGSKGGNVVQAGSGSMALPAAASCCMHMGRKGDDAFLSGDGRRVKRFELVLEGRGADWVCKGNADEVEMSEARTLIVEAIRESGPMTPRQIASATGKNNATVRVLLSRMVKAGHLHLRQDGLYTPPTKEAPVNSVNSVNSQRSEVFTPFTVFTGVHVGGADEPADWLSDVEGRDDDR